MAAADGRNWFRVLMFAALAAIIMPVAAASAPSKPNADRTNLKKVVGPNACAECHKEETEVWKKTHHFTTFKDMPRSKEAREIADKLKIKRIKSESLCLNCHFTARASGRKKKPVAGISCESCHSAGKDWEKLHSEFSGKTEQTETKAEEAARWERADKLGMIRPVSIYKLAKNCYSCHVVPQEKLVNVGGHLAGSPFELVSWSQGEVRHNLWYSKGERNAKATPNRKRMLYVVGVAVELETALRAVAVATKRQTYAFRMAQRADAARQKMGAIAKAVPEAPELAAIANLGYSAGLKLENQEALSEAADKIAIEALGLSDKYDGSTFGAVDALIPAEDKYKGSPSK